MTGENTAGDAATNAATVQTPEGNQPPKATSVEDPNSTTREGANPQNEGTEGKKEDEPGKKEDSSKNEPFHKHPAFQRMTRKNAKLSTEVQVLREQNQEITESLKELIALQKGEEHKPSVKSEEKLPDPQELLDTEMDQLVSAHDLSAEEEAEVIEIAKKYAIDLGDGVKAFLPAETAYQILKDRGGGSKETVPTRPSTATTEKNVANPGASGKPAKTIGEAVARAKAAIERQGKTNL